MLQSSRPFAMSSFSTSRTFAIVVDVCRPRRRLPRPRHRRRHRRPRPRRRRPRPVRRRRQAHQHRHGYAPAATPPAPAPPTWLVPHTPAKRGAIRTTRPLAASFTISTTKDCTSTRAPRSSRAAARPSSRRSLPHSAELRQSLLPPSASVTRRLRSLAAATSPSASRTAHRQTAHCKTVGQRRRNSATAAARSSARTAHLGDFTCLAARATSWSSPGGIQRCLRVSTTTLGSTSRRA